jgi:arylsulfatase A-like enzyme
LAQTEHSQHSSDFPPPRRLTASFLLLIVTFAVIVVLLATLGRFAHERSWTGTLQRLVPIVPVSDDPTVEQIVAQSGWTQYEDYGTVRIGRIERPARLIAGGTRWVQEVRVPPGGARYEAYVGAVGGAVNVRVATSRAPVLDVSAPAEDWTVVSFDLEARHGSTQRLTFEVLSDPEVVTAWSAETVTPLNVDVQAPDVILISLDTVRRDQLTPYEPSLLTTPNLAAFAREAVRFDRAIASSSWTIGSHSVLFTGEFPAGSLGYDSRVEPEEYTLPEIFAANGYQTYGVSGGPYTDPRWGLHQGFDEYVVSGARENAREATSRAIEWVRRDPNTPKFLFLNLFDAHEPLELSEDVRRLTGVTADVPPLLWHELDYRKRPITPEIRARLLNAYRAELRSIDEHLGRFFSWLRQNGRWERTVVIVWADHGQLLGERGQIGHAYTLEEELLNVPLIVKPAGDARPMSRTYPHLFQEADLFSLAQALAGFNTEAGDEIMRSIAADRPVKRLAFSKIHHDPLPALVAHPRWRSATQWAVRNETHKIVRDLEGRTVAYDVTGEEEHVVPLPSTDSLLLPALDGFQSWLRQRPATRTIGPLSPAEIERLRSLGYIR